MEGVGYEVFAFVGVSAVVITVIFVSLLVRNLRNRLTEEPDNDGDEATHPRLPAYNVDCPICFESFDYGVETNCRHVFCGDCIVLTHSRPIRSLLLCPLCRRQVKLLLTQFNTAVQNRKSEDITDYTRQYNKYSNCYHPQNLWEMICNMPVLLQHLLQRIMDNGFELDRILITVLVVTGIAVTYFAIPFDIFPEFIFGAYGLIDDFIIVFYSMFYLSIFYRNFLSVANET